MPTKHIDFNIDAAQGFGIFKNNKETELLDYVSSVNISCGFHAGDPLLIREYLLKCKEKNLTIGAHIGFNDIQGLGYRPMELKPEEIEAIVIYQIGALASFAKSYNLVIDHVRPHGAMYKIASENYDFSLAIAKAIQKFDKWLNYTCLDNEILEKVSVETGIVVNRELFIDKTYTQDFKVDWENKTYINDDDALNRIRTVLHSSQIKIGNGMFMQVKTDTIHFDTKNPNITQLLRKSNEIVKPTPPNYNKVETSGWV
ncbi:TPA: LamB/YcsF family protein [Candidatus Avigastranaerophilus faecigallinarum]|nr:LamB/YcsF family protein [Candidatus Avigastranaerophilus faecigallinarum]